MKPTVIDPGYVCIYTDEMLMKINYYLAKFPNVEWSGPAFFRVLYDNNGWPLLWELVYFHLLDIGTSAGTSWDDELMLTNGVYDVLEERLGDEAGSIVSGNIHSHHSMEAYFSDVDSKAVIANARPNGFWPSLIVSRNLKQDANRAFGFGYKDQYNHVIQIRPLIKEIQPLTMPMPYQPEWLNEVKTAGYSAVKYATVQTMQKNPGGISNKNKSTQSPGNVMKPENYEYGFDTFAAVKAKIGYNSETRCDLMIILALFDAIGHVLEYLTSADVLKSGSLNGRQMTFMQLREKLEIDCIWSYPTISSMFNEVRKAIGRELKLEDHSAVFDLIMNMLGYPNINSVYVGNGVFTAMDLALDCSEIQDELSEGRKMKNTRTNYVDDETELDEALRLQEEMGDSFGWCN